MSIARIVFASALSFGVLAPVAASAEAPNPYQGQPLVLAQGPAQGPVEVGKGAVKGAGTVGKGTVQGAQEVAGGVVEGFLL